MKRPAERTTLGPVLAETRRLIAVALPLIGSQLAQATMGFVDTLMLGRYDVAALAASVLGATVFFEVFIIGSGFAIAVMPLVAAALGAGDERQVRRAVRMGIWASVGWAVLMTPVMWHTGALLELLGQDPAHAAGAERYMRIAMWGLAPALVVMALRSLFSGLERTGVILWVTLAAAGLNAFLDWLLIFGRLGLPELGLEGAALASTLAHVASLAALIVIAALGAPTRRLNLWRRLWVPDPAALGEVLRLGAPIGVTLAAETGLFTGSALMMGWLGTVPLAAHGIAIQIASLTFMVHLGLANAATVRAGHAWGARDPARLRRVSLAAAAASGGFALVAMAVMASHPAGLAALFLDPAEAEAPAILSAAAGLVAIAALFQLADGAQVVALGLLRGLHETRGPMIWAIVSYWILGLPAAWALAFPGGLGGAGVWLGLVIGLTAAGLGLTLRLLGRIRAMPAAASG